MAQKDTEKIVEKTLETPEDTNDHSALKYPRLKRFKKWLVRHKMVVVPAAALVVIAGLLAVPGTRYQLVGSFVEKTVTIQVVDSQKGEPVSQAKVELDGQTILTDKNGHATLTSHAGFKQLVITKQYFKDSSSSVEVKLFSDVTSKVSLEATGRLVPVHVENRVTGKPVVNALVDAGDGNTVQTDDSGSATIVLPAQIQKAKVRIITAGYLTANSEITQDGKNKLQIVPVGSIYFLSNRSGKIDAVKASLDGSNRKTIYAGTGSENPADTSLLASRDWRYLVLHAKRSASKPASLYLIDTKTDTTTEIDTGDVGFSLIGWSNHQFFYIINRYNKNYYEPKSQALKSINAETGQLTTHDENDASRVGGSYSSLSSYSDIGNPYITDSGVVYTSVWYPGEYYPVPESKRAAIMLIPAGGQKKTLKSFSSKDVAYIQATLYNPQEIYFELTDYNDKKTYLEFDEGGIATVQSAEPTFSRRYPTFIVSPSGEKTIWREVRDGKNTIFTGDTNAEHKQELVAASEFTPYGWLTDDYILLQKDDSELYITTPEQLNSGVAPLKVSDYYKTPNDFYGYGYGYGGQ